MYDKARTGTNAKAGESLFAQLTADVKSNRLPKISWIAAPEAFTEHPNWPANYGAWYISQVLDALTSNPEVWSKTALFITYDENDGFFDHVVPPYPPMSAAQGLSTVDVGPDLYTGTKVAAGPVRSGSARADARRVALEHRRLRLLGDVRPHLDHPVHGAAVRRARAEHLAVAAGDLR